MRHRAISATVLGLTLSACWLGQIPYHDPAEVPTAADLAGSWGATAGALADFAAEGLSRYATAEAHRIDLRSDGTCSARTFFGASTNGYEVDLGMPCGWRVIPDLPLVELTVTTEAGEVYQQVYFIGEDDGALILYSHLSDPAAERYAELSRTPAVKPRRRTTRCS